MTAIKALGKNKPLYDFYMSYIKRQNNVFIRSQITMLAVGQAADEFTEEGGKIWFNVPPLDNKEKAKVSRTHKEISEIISRMRSEIIFSDALGVAISGFEDFASKMMIAVLCAYPGKLSVSPKGNSGDQTFGIKELTKLSSLEEFYRDCAEKRVREAVYAAPEEYLAYAKAIFGDVDATLAAQYAEIKATRDLAVHNGYIINDIYLRKAGPLARGAVGQRIKFDEAYLHDSFCVMKRLAGSFYAVAKKKFVGKDEFERVLASYPELLGPVV